MNLSSLFDPLPDTVMALSPCQSLALRQMIDELKRDDSVYSTCPDVVRRAIAELVLPSHTSAEEQIKCLIEANAAGLKLIEKFSQRIRELEKELSGRREK